MNNSHQWCKKLSYFRNYSQLSHKSIYKLKKQAPNWYILVVLTFNSIDFSFDIPNGFTRRNFYCKGGAHEGFDVNFDGRTLQTHIVAIETVRKTIFGHFRGLLKTHWQLTNTKVHSYLIVKPGSNAINCMTTDFVKFLWFSKSLSRLGTCYLFLLTRFLISTTNYHFTLPNRKL